ncbi:GNAT family N-acetyltransferase [Nitrospirillum iridis]|uniref:RimJ/RimL family protein N-acetyltransferase n=1 Tax=Nitrospirillum iridis TaxID=765888 RepID=A0A7X0AX40_9PROT|nr:GNAT family protein [Nitrospirillum iridis]MBB6250705.1 RimJ/RimL family protein N-acetyltransferase [Nitrospirillum iridis]
MAEIDTTPMTVSPVTLKGAVVRLEPLSHDHLPGLIAVGLDPVLWRWIPTPVTTPDEMRTYVRTALEERDRHVSLPFAIMHKTTGQVIGSTRYGNIDRANRRVEIGWTWVARSHQRTGANTDAKRLLLTHAFETLGAHRVELKTDALNTQSRAAIARIGATQEGVFRSHVVVAPRVGPDGQMIPARLRDSVYFSVIHAEWPTVKERLASLARRD